MDKPMPGIAFNMMSLAFKVVDLFVSPDALLDEVGIREGNVVLDFACGPGRYEPSLSRRVGPAGTVYALDIHPLAVQKVANIVKTQGLANVKTILSDRATGLPAESVDVVLLLDVFHMFGDPEGVLRELHRVLKEHGVLACTIEHMDEATGISSIEETGCFGLCRQSKRVVLFAKNCQTSGSAVGS